MSGRHGTRAPLFPAVASTLCHVWEHVTYGVGFTYPAALLVAANGLAAAVVLALR